MKVFGYFCVGANTKWGLDHPDQSYGSQSVDSFKGDDRNIAVLARAYKGLPFNYSKKNKPQ